MRIIETPKVLGFAKKYLLRSRFKSTERKSVMFRKMVKIVPVLVLTAVVGAMTLLAPAGDANARTTQCWKCVGGWCCY